MAVAPFVPMSEVDARQIARWLADGSVVVVPTETVYGLAVKPGDAASADRVFALKGRPPEMNLPVVIGHVEQLAPLAVDFNDTARELAEAFWPGPLTIVMGFRADRPRPAWLSGRDEIAIRFPAFALLRDVANAAGPILLTSANGHGLGPKPVARDAVDSLHGAPDFVVDGGTLTSTPSTIINTRRTPARVERMGAVTAADLRAFIERKRVVLD